LRLIPEDVAGGTEHGTFYAPDGKLPDQPLSNTWYKVYVEEAALQAALETGGLEQAYRELADAGLGPYAVKLSGGDRFVFYFSSDIRTTSQQVEAVLAKQGVGSRGPAQDVNEVTVDEATNQFVFQPVESNDDALEEPIPGYDTVDPPAYERASFLHNYLGICARYGKSPVNAFRTSFVVTYRAPDFTRYDEPEFYAAAANIVKPYQLVVRTW